MRRPPILAAFLLAGCLINVAIAWACVLAVDVTEYTDFARTPYSTWAVSRADPFGTTRIAASHHTSIDQKPLEAAPPLVPKWTGFDEPSPAFLAGATFEFRIVEGRGWPFRSLWCEIGGEWRTPNSPFVANDGRGGIDTGLPTTVRIADPTTRHLPYLPIWSGLVANSLLFAVAAWSLAWTSRHAIGRQRQRKGRCSSCGYQMHEARPCPECGADQTNRRKER